MRVYRFLLIAIFSISLIPGVSFANDDWNDSDFGSESEMSDRLPASADSLDTTVEDEEHKPVVSKAKKRAKKIAKRKKRKKRNKKKKKSLEKGA